MKVSYLPAAPAFDPFSECKYVSAGNSVMLMSADHRNRIARIRKIDSDRYTVISSGEVKEFEHWENRADGKNSLRKSVQKLRDLINSNCTESENLLWLTLTYAENMTDVKRLYRDWDKFWKRMKYHLKSESVDIPEYIDVIEPQARGAWHHHVFLIWNHKAPFIPNDKVSSIWSHGFCKTKSVSSVDNIGAYFSAYLCNLPVEECENYSSGSVIEAEVPEDGKKVTKKFVKGARLDLYPKGVRFYRTSRGIKNPDIEYMPLCDAEKRVDGLKPQYRTAFLLTDEDSSLSITVVKTYYNKRRADNQMKGGDTV